MWKKIIIKFYFYCTKIRALLRTSLMFLWELKNAIISQNLRGLCDIKTNTKNPHTVASWTSFADLQSVLSHQLFHYTVPERRRRQGRGKELSSTNAWACRRHIISIALNPCTLLNISDVPLRTQKHHHFTKSPWTLWY